MSNPYYNGIVTYQFTVVVKSNNHQTCLSIAKRIKDYFSAWYFGCSYPHEYKSARKGDVLNREIQARFEGYPSNVIAFREGLRCICFHYDLYATDTTVKIVDHGTSPNDSRLNILK